MRKKKETERERKEGRKNSSPFDVNSFALEESALDAREEIGMLSRIHRG